MRLEQKKSLLEVVRLFYELHQEVKKSVQKKNEALATDLLIQCQQRGAELGNAIEAILGEGTESVSLLEEYCEHVYEMSTQIRYINAAMCRGQLDQSIRKVEECLKTLSCEKPKLLFLPYKASMWTSFESIYQCAASDPDCQASVVPIPYYEIGDSLKEPVMRYEGDCLPTGVPIVKWEDYRLEEERPDIIFIHNPYDDGNNLTSVHPFYYSSNLKKYTQCLVYSPYFTFSRYTRGRSDGYYMTSGTVNADKILVQSEFVKEIYKSYGYPEEKLVALGSPKMDAVVKENARPAEMPEEWKAKLSGKTVFLLNTHLSYFPTSSLYVERYGFDFAQRYHEQLMKAILNQPEYGLIWRPHPLLFTMIETRFPDCLTYARDLEKRMEESENCVIDRSGDYRAAFSCSDAMITTYSSMINEYMATGKPIMIFQTKPTDEAGERSPMDLRTCYFKFKKDGGMPFKDFLSMVQRGEDTKREERMQMLHGKAFANLDGTAGEKIYASLKEWIMR